MQITVPHEAGIALAKLEEAINDIEARIGRIVDLQAVEGPGEDGDTKKLTYSAHLLWNPPSDVAVLKKEGEAAPDGMSLVIAGTAYIEGVEGKAVIKVYRKEASAPAQGDG
jgi:hypothetical protein